MHPAYAGESANTDVPQLHAERVVANRIGPYAGQSQEAAMGSTDVMSETSVTDIATFSAWLASGGTPLCVYHVGNLAGAIGGGTPRNAQMRELARGVWNAAVKRQVYLLQRRFGCEPVQYLAIRPRDGSVPARFAPADIMLVAAAQGAQTAA
jgi:hypothetical protein